MAASYRLLQDHYLSNQLVPAGTTITEGDGICPIGWVPTPNVDPLNTQAVQNFYNAGPQQGGLIRQQFTPTVGSPFLPIGPPVTYWLNVGGFSGGFSPGFMGGIPLWQLTGLGANILTYPPVQRQL